jgi:hypothetical protein
MIGSCYLRKSIVYIPHLVKEVHGAYAKVGPVAVVPVSDTEALRRAFHATISHGVPVVPPPSPTDRDELDLVVPKSAGLKSFPAFARGASPWGIVQKDGLYEIRGSRKGPVRGWVDDPEQKIVLPPGSSLDDLVERMILVLQAAASKQGSASE